MTGLQTFFATRQALASIEGVNGVSMAVDVQTDLKKKIFRFRGLFKWQFV